ncbi:MAG TPA: hypothetical protein VII20_07585 [Roseiarcus sp.]|jgi:hypothetical protein
MREQEHAKKRADAGLHVGHKKIQRLEGPNAFIAVRGAGIDLFPHMPFPQLPNVSKRRQACEVPGGVD